MPDDMTVEELCAYCSIAEFQGFTCHTENQLYDTSVLISGSFDSIELVDGASIRLKNSKNSLVIERIQKIQISSLDGLPIQEISIICGVESDITKCDKYIFLAWE